MDDHDVYPPEMPDRPSSPILPLDDNPAERLLANRLDPDDAPPAYAPVARLLRAAAAPPGPDELAGQPAALAAFRAERPGTTGSAGPAAGVQGRPVRAPGRPRWAVRRRLVAVALAGALVVGGAAAGVAATGGLWTADAISSLVRLRSPTGGPGTDGPGSSVPGVGSDGAGSGGAGSGGAGSGRSDGAGHGPAVDDSKAKARKAKEPTAEQPKGGKPNGGKPNSGKPSGGKPTRPAKPKSGGPKAAAHQGGNGHGHTGEWKEPPDGSMRKLGRNLPIRLSSDR